MTGRPAVQRLGQDRETIGDAPNIQALGSFLDQQLVAARLRRRLENAVRIVRQPFIRSEEADVSIDAVVVRLEVVVGDRPVVAETIEALAPEIVRTEPQRSAVVDRRGRCAIPSRDMRREAYRERGKAVLAAAALARSSS